MTPFTADHHGFYHEGIPFDCSQVVKIRLPAGPQDDLKWTAEMARGQEAVDAGLFLLWELDLGLSEKVFTPTSLSHFSSLFFEVDAFCKHILDRFAPHTFGVILYKGSADMARLFPKEAWESEWNERLKESSIEESTGYLLFCAGVLSEALHSLVSLLPDSLLVFALLDVSVLPSFALIAHLFLHERFEHINLAFAGVPFPCNVLLWQGESLTYQVVPASRGLLLPRDASFTRATLNWLDTVSTCTTQCAFRVVAEENLTEEWDGLDELIIPSEETLGLQAKRKLQGFVAAGGTIREQGEKI